MKICYICGVLLMFLVYLVESQREDTVIDGAENSIKIGQTVTEQSSNVHKKFNISKHLLMQRKTPDGRPYAVFDNIIPPKFQLLIKTYLTFDNDAWLFNNYDAEAFNDQRTYDNTPWINNQDPVAFSKTKLSERLTRAVSYTSKEDVQYYPYRVFGKVIRRGDHTRVSADSTEEGEYSVLVFVNEFWKKNYYGELFLYDKDREVIGGATHKAGRVVVWESTMPRLNRPPAVQFLQGQILFQVQFTKNLTKMTEYHLKWIAYQKERMAADKAWFLPDYKLPNGDVFVPPDPEKYKKFEWTSKIDGRKVFVYDNLFPEDLLNRLRHYVLNYGSYYYDDSLDDESDNVQWIAGFLIPFYINSPYWKIVKKVASHASGSNVMFPYDVSINLIRSSDHTRIHGDVSYYGEEEFTCLVYLNPNWTKNDYGETTFFEKNSDDTEVIAQVRPRYGRTVIFDGNIPHSARPPSFNFTGGRLTFVTKLHKNEFYGRKKNLVEEMRQYQFLSHQLMKELKLLRSKHGNAFAKKRIQDVRDMFTQMTFQPDPELQDEHEREEDVDPGNQEQTRKEQMSEDISKVDHGETNHVNEYVSKMDVFSEITGEDIDAFDDVTLQMLSPLKDLFEHTEGAVEVLKKVHEDMLERQAQVKNIYREKLLSTM